MTEHLFVYGTLMRGSNNPHAKTLARSATFLGPAVFQGRLFLVGDYPAAVPSKDARHQVHGEIFRLDRAGLLSKLDEYEDSGDDFASPTEYMREKQDVRQPSGAQLQVWIYLYNRSTDHLPILENGRFIVPSHGPVVTL